MDCTSILKWLGSLPSSLITSEMVSALFGALIGGLFTMWATSRSHSLSALATEAADEKLLYDTARLIQVEIETAVQIYQEEYGKDLLDLTQGEPYINVFPIGLNPFPIFDSSPACLSRLPHSLSSLIVRLYMRAKGLISMIEINNSSSEKAMALANERLKEMAARLHEKELSPEDLQQQLDDYYYKEVFRNATLTDMGSTADAMRDLTIEILDMVAELNRKLAANRNSRSD